MGYINKSIRKLILHNLALLGLVLVSFSVIASTYDPAPTFKLPTVNGKNIVDLSKYKGDVVYVDFWATWCPPCRRSFPWMEKMYQKYHDHGFHIIAISIDRKQEIIDRFLSKTPISFIVAKDDNNKTANAYKVTGMPTSFIIDSEGYIHSRHVGFRESDKVKIEQEFEALLLN